MSVHDGYIDGNFNLMHQSCGIDPFLGLDFSRTNNLLMLLEKISAELHVGG